MEPPVTKNDDRLTPSQRRAVNARGNVLVMAGAGTGKTHTLVERCLHCLCQEQPPASLVEILVVTLLKPPPPKCAGGFANSLRKNFEPRRTNRAGRSNWRSST